MLGTSYVTVPADPGPVRVNVVPLIVDGFIASLNVAVAVALGHAPFPGVSDTTVGVPTVPEQDATPIEKLHTKLFAK